MSKLNFAELASNLKTQDNLATQHPLYCVYSKRSIYIEDGYGGMETKDVWVDADDYSEVEGDGLSEALSVISEGYDSVEVTVDDYKRQYHRKTVGVIPQFETACLTRAGADAYLEANGHNLNQPYIHVHSLNRNDEMIGLREHVIDTF
ncbi:hypothetical protein [Psychrobacter sp. AOP7-A1-24]|uniref:hypothetical protein n=1 Tax=Psychrobacter sp. AOP7-A1-24 TaxID=3457646 RepID=UPI00402BBBAF